MLDTESLIKNVTHSRSMKTANVTHQKRDTWINVRMNQTERDTLKEIAKINKCSKSTMIRTLIRTYRAQIAPPANEAHIL